jgi:hypothetical protein
VRLLDRETYIQYYVNCRFQYYLPKSETDLAQEKAQFEPSTHRTLGCNGSCGKTKPRGHRCRLPAVTGCESRGCTFIKDRICALSHFLLRSERREVIRSIPLPCFPPNYQNCSQYSGQHSVPVAWTSSYLRL